MLALIISYSKIHGFIALEVGLDKKAFQKRPKVWCGHMESRIK